MVIGIIMFIFIISQMNMQRFVLAVVFVIFIARIHDSLFVRS